MATRCIEALDSNQQDITMLWWLQQPKWLQQFKAGRDLLDWAMNTMGIPPREFTSDGFQREVTKAFEKRRVQPVASDRVVASWKKDTAKEMCLAERWPKPYFPVMLQTRPGEGQGGGSDRGKGKDGGRRAGGPAGTAALPVSPHCLAG